jgi:hypothetical protein
MYFETFPTINYSFNEKIYQLSDIFKRVAFSQKSLDNKFLFNEYYMVDGETLESVSNKIYGDSTLSWILMLANNITTQFDIPQRSEKLENYLNNKYPGKILFFSQYLSNIQAGDFIAQVTVTSGEITSTSTTNYAVIKEYNPVFRYIIVNSIYGTLSSPTTVGFYRKVNSTYQNITFDVVEVENGDIETRGYANILKVSNEKDTPIDFLSSTGNYLSPYSINSTDNVKSNAIGTYNPLSSSDVETVYNTSLYKYMNNTSNNLLSSVVTHSTKLYADNEKARIIKVLKPAYLGYVLSEVPVLLNSTTEKVKNIEIEVQ